MAGEQPHVGLDRGGAAQTLEFALLQNAQQFHLGGEAEVADFVEEQGAAVGQFEATFLAGVRPGEGPFFMSEQLGFDQGFGQRGATHLNERPLGAHRIVVDGVGNQFLAGTRFAANQHVGIGRRLPG